MNQSTHQTIDGRRVQIVPADVLRRELRSSGDTLARPADWGPDDEWDVGNYDAALTESDYDLGFEALDAVSLDNDEVAHFDDASHAWWIVDRDDVAKLGELLRLETVDAYSRWCGNTFSTEVKRSDHDTLERLAAAGIEAFDPEAA